MFGYTADELSKQQVEMLAPADVHEPQRQHGEDVMEAGIALVVEVRRLRRTAPSLNPASA